MVLDRPHAADDVPAGACSTLGAGGDARDPGDRPVDAVVTDLDPLDRIPVAPRAGTDCRSGDDRDPDGLV